MKRLALVLLAACKTAQTAPVDATQRAILTGAAEGGTAPKDAIGPNFIGRDEKRRHA